MAIELFRKVKGLNTLAGRVAIFNARKNRLVKRGFKLEVKVDIRWDLFNEVSDILNIRWNTIAEISDILDIRWNIE